MLIETISWFFVRLNPRFDITVISGALSHPVDQLRQLLVIRFYFISVKLQQSQKG